MKKFSTFSGKLEGKPKGFTIQIGGCLAKKQLSSDSRKYCRYWVNVTFKLVYLKLAMALTG